MSDESFAELFAQSDRKRPKMPKAGDRVSGTVTNVGTKRLTIDLGDGVDGMMELIELGDNVAPAVGEKIEGYVMSIENRVAQIGRAVGSKGQHGAAALEQAHATRVPVEGTVKEVNKGGYVVEIGAVRCFCPLGQMDLRRIEDPNTQIGKKLSFIVTEVKGRDVVLSRRALLETEAKAARSATMEKLVVGAILDGNVVGVREFGAFIDLGGVDGMVPNQELGFGRAKASDTLKIGEKVRVQVMKIEGDKISLSMRALMANPLEAALTELEAGLVLRGKVTSIQAFGAFVELAPGVEGLIHVSRFGKRVATPGDIVKVGDVVTVRVEKIEDRKIGLTYMDQFDGSETKTTTGLVVLGRYQAPEAPAAPARKIVAAPQVNAIVQCTVDKIENFGVFVTFEGGRGLVPTSELDAHTRGNEIRKNYPVGSTFRALILEIRNDGKIRLSKKATEAAEERAEAEAFLKSQGGSSGFGAFAAALSGAIKQK